MFITFEGIDCSGKTTQATLLVERLRELGKDVLFLREPGGTTISESIRTLLLDRRHPELTQRAELLLFSAARTQLVSQVIKPALASGRIVVCDRFVDSTTAYQGYGRGLDLGDVAAINRIALCGTTPDLTLFVDVSVEEVARRKSEAGLPADRMESAGTEFFARVRRGYQELATAESGRFVTIDGMQPIEQIRDAVWRAVQSKLS